MAVVGLPRWLSGKEAGKGSFFTTWVWSLSQEDSPGGGNGNPRQYSCLECPVNRGAWKVTIHRVAKNRTWLKWLSRHAYTWPKAKQKRQWKKINVLWVLSPSAPHEMGSLDPVWACAQHSVSPRPIQGQEAKADVSITSWSLEKFVENHWTLWRDCWISN